MLSEARPKAMWLSLIHIFLCAGILVIVLFQMQMHQNFLNMTEYYYLWQMAFPAETLAIMTAVLAAAGRIRLHKPEREGEPGKINFH